MNKSINKIVLAYSGGLDTSAMLLWLKETYGCEVVCFCADVGQGDEMDGLEEKALNTGASRLYIEDLREEFVKDFVWTAVKANALYEGVYLLGTSLARPVIAKKQIEIAQREGADAVAHGATGKGNDQVRFELTYYALQPDIKVVAPWRHWEFKGRADLIAYCAKHNINVTATAEKPYSMDRNLMHISYEGGILENPWSAPPDDIFLLTKSPEMALDTAEEMIIEFDKGEPIAINGEKYGAGFEAFAVLAATLPGIPLIYGGQEGQLDKRIAFFEKDAIDWKACDNLVVCPALEHPNNRYMWLHLARRLGLELRLVPAPGNAFPVEAMVAAMVHNMNSR